MSRALSQIGHADYRSTNYTGFPSELDEQPEPVGDAEADCDNDEAFRQSSLDRMDFTPVDPLAPFEHAGHTIRPKSKPSPTWGLLFSADIVRPDGSPLEWGLWWVHAGEMRRAARAFVDQNGGGK